MSVKNEQKNEWTNELQSRNLNTVSLTEKWEQLVWKCHETIIEVEDCQLFPKTDALPGKEMALKRNFPTERITATDQNHQLL